MFKIALTAATLSLTALSVQATPTANITLPESPALVTLATSAPIAEDATQFEEVAYYCEWATVYDYYGNWITVWQCY